MSILAAVNVLWAAAFFGYVKRSTTPVIKPGGDANLTRVIESNRTITPIVNQSPVARITNSPPAVAVAPASVTNTPPRAVHQYGWQDVTNEIYPEYIAKLRATGCPEKQVRNIVISDVNELFDQRRLEHAIKNDPQWWKSDTFMGILPRGNFGSVNFDEERRALLVKILGEDAADSVKLPSLNSSGVDLTGPVLGALPADTWNSVQEICARASDRAQAFQMAHMNEPGGGMDNIEAAKLRDMTRQDLSKVLTPEQVEEFLLRFSHNSSKLRQDMRGLDLTPDEFRKIFRAIDPLEHQLQVDYGGPESLSQKQREQLEAQRDRAVKETLSPQRYAQYLGMKDPLYRQAQMMAMQYGMNSKAVQALYEMQKSLDTKRAQISQNAIMTAEQKAQALQSIGLEHQQTLQRLLTDATYRQ